jgi:hypothetical protein
MTQGQAIQWLETFLPDLAKAGERIIRDMEARPFEHPYYWAGYYISGDL